MLLKIELPQSYEDAIVDTQVVYQEKLTAESIRNATVVRQKIEVDRSNATKEVAIINAEAQSNATYIANQALAQIIKNTVVY